MPSNQVWPKTESSELLQFLNQAPPGAQQLSRPDFLKMPHLEHTKLIVGLPLKRPTGAAVDGSVSAAVPGVTGVT